MEERGAPRCRAGLEYPTPSAQLYGSRTPPVDVDQCRHSVTGAHLQMVHLVRRFDMTAIIKPEMISRRKALSLMGLAAAFGLAAAPTY